MTEVQLTMNDKGHGAFVVLDGPKQLGEMVVGISGSDMTVYHTEVIPEAEGQGLAKMMLEAMVDHARTSHLKVIPLCPYVLAQFQKNPANYAEIWDNPEGQSVS